MPGTFENKDKLIRAQEIVVSQGNNKEDWPKVLAEYQKLGGPYRDDPGDPLLLQAKELAKTKMTKTKKLGKAKKAVKKKK